MTVVASAWQRLEGLALLAAASLATALALIWLAHAGLTGPSVMG